MVDDDGHIDDLLEQAKPPLLVQIAAALLALNGTMLAVSGLQTLLFLVLEGPWIAIPVAQVGCGLGSVAAAFGMGKLWSPAGWFALLLGALSALVAGLWLIGSTLVGFYSPLFDPEPPDGDIFDEGDPISATAAGDVVPAFQVQTTGVATIHTSMECPLELEAGQTLVVTWTPATQGDSIRFVLRSGNHGSQFSSVVCETEDDGLLTVDAAIIDAYLAEWRPVEMWHLVRYREGTTVAGETLVSMRTVTSYSCMW